MLALLVAGQAAAGPSVGALRPLATAEHPDGQRLDLSALTGKTVVLFYEDRKTNKVNAALKTALGALRGREGVRGRLKVVAVADVSSYDFWPARNFAKSAIRKKIKKHGVPIYCDWKGAFRAAYGLREDTANVVVIAGDGRVVFFKEGKLGEDEIQRVLGLALGS